ncbi:hypothetical protein LJB90_02320 [Eubacteriales bacterium OttesenSCG-928-G02]|nr:hypothetical protein [Eubacteriales bacterium OttesenSCG-928-G02]
MMAEIVENEIPIGGLLSIEELNGSQVIMPEFTAPTFRPKVTLNYRDLTFNSSCVKLFPDSEYFQLLVDEKKKRMIAIPCGQYDVGVVKWSNIKKGKPQPRNIKAKVACAKIFRLMDWDITYRYKVMAIYQELNGIKLVVFNFADCTMLIPEEVIGKDGNVRTKRHTVYPLEWEKLFGPTYGEHRKQYEVDIQTYHLLSGQMTEEQPPVVPRVPTPEEIMTRNYYVPDDIDKQ